MSNTREMKKAFALWAKKHLHDKRFKPIYGKIQKNGLPVVCFYNKDDECGYCWSLQYAGNGHYFKTEEEMFQYAMSRGLSL